MEAMFHEPTAGGFGDLVGELVIRGFDAIGGVGVEVLEVDGGSGIAVVLTGAQGEGDDLIAVSGDVLDSSEVAMAR